MGELRAVHGVAHDEAAGLVAPRADLVEQPPVAEDAGGVGRELQARADLAELGSPFQHADLSAGPGEGQGTAEAADAAADHEGGGVGSRARAHAGTVGRAGTPARAVLVSRPSPTISVTSTEPSVR